MTRSRKSVFLILAAVLFSFLPMAGSSTTRAQDEGPIILGAPVNLTDWMAAMTSRARRGKAGCQANQRSGGVLGCELQIIELDGQTIRRSGNVARELIDQGAKSSRTVRF